MCIRDRVTAVPGLPASEEAVHAMRARDVDISSHVSKPVSSRDMAGADLVIAMTLAHKKLLLSRYSEFENKIRTLSEVLPGVFDGDVMDPYGQAQTCLLYTSRCV